MKRGAKVSPETLEHMRAANAEKDRTGHAFTRKIMTVDEPADIPGPCVAVTCDGNRHKHVPRDDRSWVEKILGCGG